MTHALVQALAQQGDQVDALVAPYLKSLVTRMPSVGACHTLPHQSGRLNLRSLRATARSLCGRYPKSVVVPNSWKTALVPWLAQIPQRVGWLGEQRWGLLTQAYRHPEQYPRMVDRLIHLSGKTGSFVPHLRPLHPTPRHTPTWAICPGAAFGPAKQWPVRHFSAVIKALHQQGLGVVLLGGPQDVGVGEAILNLCPEVPVDNQIGQGDLGQAVDNLASVCGVLTHDSGLMHVAAALGRPVVALYGPSSSKFTPPLAAADRWVVVRNPLVCSPCFERSCPLKHHACMEHLTPESVLAAMERLCPKPLIF